MEALDELIRCEERKLEHLMQIRNHTSFYDRTSLPEDKINNAEDIDYDIEKAYEQLSIYKIRKLMGF
jgi:hypothetical protein